MTRAVLNVKDKTMIAAQKRCLFCYPLCKKCITLSWLHFV